MELGGGWSQVVGGVRWWVESGGGWSQVVGGVRWWVESGGGWSWVVGGVGCFLGSVCVVLREQWLLYIISLICEACYRCT